MMTPGDFYPRPQYRQFAGLGDGTLFGRTSTLFAAPPIEYTFACVDCNSRCTYTNRLNFAVLIKVCWNCGRGHSIQKNATDGKLYATRIPDPELDPAPATRRLDFGEALLEVAKDALVDGAKELTKTLVVEGVTWLAKEIFGSKPKPRRSPRCHRCQHVQCRCRR